MAASGTVTISLAGCPISITTKTGLNAAERTALDTLNENAWIDEECATPFQLDVCQEPPWQPDELRPPAGGAARICVTGDSVAIDHHEFRSTLDLNYGRGVLRRTCTLAFPLEISLRTAMCCCLPLLGGVALHSAGIVLNGVGIAFFGPSGAGKSTLSSLSPHPVVSDELVALAGPPWTLRATGFWGEFGAPDTVLQRGAHLEALVELAKGPGPQLERIPAQSALRRLLRMLVLPPAPSVWHKGLRVAEALCREVPMWRLQWSPDCPPWDLLATLIKS